MSTAKEDKRNNEESFRKKAKSQVFEQPIYYNSIKDSIIKAVEHLNNVYHDKNDETETFLGFDSDTLKKGNLIVLASRPFIGKTSFILSLIKHLSFDQDIPTGLLIPGTMDSTMLGQRMISLVSGVSLARIRSAILKKEEIKKIQDAANNLFDKPFYIINEPNCSLSYFQSAAKTLFYEKKIELLVIDDFEYLENIIDADKEEYRFILSNTLDELKNLAEELKIPVVITMSLPSDNEDIEPSIQDFKKYLIIPQKADKVMFIHRERMYDAEPNIIPSKLIVAKNEVGSTRYIPLNFDNQILLFSGKKY